MKKKRIIAAAYHLHFNASLMVAEGLGYAIGFIINRK